jgi:mRNA interferase RelE/StbE
LAYNITFKKSVERDLKRISKKNAKRILDKIDAELVKNPQRFPALSGPFAGMRKFRVGDYRAIFVIIDRDVLVLRIQDRKDVYRKK